MKITAVFTIGGTPQEGLTPIIDIYTYDGVQVVVGEPMEEIAIGGYYYDFLTYEYSKDYLIRCDGGISLGSNRYIYSTNEVSSNNYDINNGNWTIVANQMIMYNADGQEIVRYNLLDKNNTPSMGDVFRRVKV